MCDDNTVREDKDYLSRRAFGAIGGAAAATVAFPALAQAKDALAVVEHGVTITTPDGVCDAHFAYPARGKHPGVVVWPDIRGLRPAFNAMGKRLAESGYAVLTVNPFYRSAKAPVLAPGETFQDPPVREKLMGMRRLLTADAIAKDAAAFVGYLDAQGSVDTKKKVGVTGYCMGGPITMQAAAALPDRIGAGASFHGAGLATDQPGSPHLLVPKMKSSFLFAVAQNDDERNPKEKELVREAFAAAKLPAEIEVYPAQHGWCPPDSQVYDQVQAERAWSRLLLLFKTALV